MARQRRHLPGTRVSLVSRPFALPPQGSQSVSSPVGAPVPPHADLFTDHNQTAGDWPKVRLSVYAVSQSMHVRTEPGEPRGWAPGESEQGSGELQVHEAEAEGIYGESAGSGGLMRRGLIAMIPLPASSQGS